MNHEYHTGDLGYFRQCKKGIIAEADRFPRTDSVGIILNRYGTVADDYPDLQWRAISRGVKAVF